MKTCDDRAYVVETTLAAAATSSSNTPAITSSLLMAMVEKVSDLLLHGYEGVSSDPTLWCLDTGATNYMSSCRNFFSELDESTSGFLKFDDNSRI